MMSLKQWNEQNFFLWNFLVFCPPCRSVDHWLLRAATLQIVYSYVCQGSNTFYMCVRRCPVHQNTKCVSYVAFYMCVTKCVHMCVTKCVYMCVTKCVCWIHNGARFARLPLLASLARFFNSLNWNSCLKEHSCLNTDSCLVIVPCANIDSCLKYRFLFEYWLKP